METLGISPVFNTAYSPEHNPIELVFAKVKHYFKVAKTNAIVNKRKEDTQLLIKRSFQKVSKEEVRNCIDHCLKELRL